MFRLVAAIASGDQTFELPDKLYRDVSLFTEMVESDLPDANLIKDMGLRRIKPADLMERLKVLFVNQQ